MKNKENTTDTPKSNLGGSPHTGSDNFNAKKTAKKVLGSTDSMDKKRADDMVKTFKQKHSKAYELLQTSESLTLKGKRPDLYSPRTIDPFKKGEANE